MEKYFVRVYRDCVYEVEIEASSKTDAYSKVVDEITENGLSNLYLVDESFDYNIDSPAEQLNMSVENYADDRVNFLVYNDVRDVWFDDNESLIPDDGGYECYGCDCWRSGEGCVPHMKGKTCYYK